MPEYSTAVPMQKSSAAPRDESNGSRGVRVQSNGARGAGALAFEYPCHAIAYGDYSLVADHGNNRVEQLSKGVQHLWTGRRRSIGPGAPDGSGRLHRPVALLAERGLLYVAERASGRITVFRLPSALAVSDADTDFQVVRTIGLGFGAAPGQLAHPCGLACHDGVLFVTEAGNHRISRFSCITGDHLGCFGVDGGLLDNPAAVLADEATGVTVASYCNHRLVRFSLHGECTCVHGGDGDTSTLRLPWGLAVSLATLVVAEHEGSLQLFDHAALTLLRVVRVGLPGTSMLKHISVCDDSTLLVCDSGQHCVLAVTGLFESPLPARQ